jgi:hypothetical protein
MPRTLTLAALRESQKEHGLDPFLVLLTIEVDAPGEWIRVVNNTENIISRGETFIGCPFQIALPDINDYTSSDATLTIDNVDPRIWQGVRMLTSAPRTILEVILASDPDDVMLRTEGLHLREAQATSQSITGKLVPDTIWQAGFPAHDFDPSQNPGMFTS